MAVKGKNSKGKSNKKTGASKAKSAAKSTAKATDKAAKAAASAGPVSERGQRIKDDIIAILLLAFGIFLLVALFSDLAGAVGHAISNGLKGSFGLGAFLLPVILIGYTILVFMSMNRPVRIRSIIVLIISFLLIDMMNAARFLDNAEFGLFSFKDVYKDGLLLKNGGVFGMYAGKLVDKAFGIMGLYIIGLVGLLICTLLLVNSPISRWFDKMKDRKRQREERKLELEAERDKAIAAREAANAEKDTEDDYQESFAQSPVFDINDNDYDDDEENEKKGASIMNILKKSKKDKPAQDDKGPLYVTPVAKEGPSPAAKAFGRPDESQEDIDKATAEVAAVGRQSIENSMTDYRLPGLDLLDDVKKTNRTRKEELELRDNARVLEETLESFGVDAKVTNVTKGSSVTRYEVQPQTGVKVSSITRLADDIALNLKAKSIRMEAPIPGKAAVGIEVENSNREMVTIKEMLASPEFNKKSSKLQFVVGKDLNGRAIVADLEKMPHMLIAGATGSGKSVCINSIITSFLYNARPDEVKLVLIDPKMVELGNYNGIPHLLVPVVTDSTKAAAALNWAVAEMTDRYKKFAAENVRELRAYNNKMRRRREPELPKIVIIIDELADLMMVASKQVEEAISRLAQLARAAGMHLIVATQRPSVDVITGLIKANITSRIAFMVSSQIDSRTIIDGAGAEKLVGNGDMLFKPQNLNKPIRLQGPFISDDEVRRVIDFIKAQTEEEDQYSEEVIQKIKKNSSTDSDEDQDEFFDDAAEVVISAGQASVSMLQRRFRIGYNRAARLVDSLEAAGIIGPQDGPRPRSVLLTEEEWAAMKEQEEE